MGLTQEKYYERIIDLCVFMTNQINTFPENIIDQEVQWPRVVADVYMLYDRPVDNEMLKNAIMLIQDVTSGNLTNTLTAPEGKTIH